MDSASFSAWVTGFPGSTGDGESGLGELRRGALRSVLLGLLVLSAVVLFLGVDGARPQTLAPVAILALGVYLTSRCEGLGYAVAVATLLAVLTLTAVLALCVFPPPFALVSFVLVVMAAGLLFGPLGGLLTAGAVTGLTLALVPRLGVAVPGEFAGAAIFGAWVSAALAWIASHPLSTALGWAWSSYDQARSKTEELQARQGELNRALKSLNEAYYRLARANEELARARKAAEQARQAKNEFASTISHELRTPLNLILGFSEMMVLSPRQTGAAGPLGSAPGGVQDAVLPEGFRGDVEAIYRNACHISNLIDDVLDLSQIEAYRMALERQPVSLQEVGEAAAATVEILYKDKGLELRLDIPADLPLLNIDPVRIRQVLINLLANAARFTNRGGVTITAARQGYEVLVSVVDTGVGIPAADLPLVFQEFNQGSASIRQRYGGSGLGLAVSKRFVEMHGGRMWVESQAGAGSTFRFTLPLGQGVAPATHAPNWDRLTPERGTARTVAVLGADGTASGLVRRYLDGYQVLAAADAGRLRTLVRRRPTQAVVLAVPSGGHGDDGAPADRDPAGIPTGIPAAIASSVPIVACEIRTPRPADLDAGVAAYLVKPVSRERLRAALKRVARDARTVLVVEDDPEMARLLAGMIHSCSRRAQVRCAPSAEEALRLLDGAVPGVVLLDLSLPGMSGQQLLRRLRARPALRDVPVREPLNPQGFGRASPDSVLGARRRGLPQRRAAGRPRTCAAPPP
jgi:signal transduction histidine kinase/CheY-like chemotaxis protein